MLHAQCWDLLSTAESQTCTRLHKQAFNRARGKVTSVRQAVSWRAGPLAGDCRTAHLTDVLLV